MARAVPHARLDGWPRRGGRRGGGGGGGGAGPCLMPAWTAGRVAAAAGGEAVSAVAQTWDVWSAATGVPVVRGRVAPTAVLWVEGAPAALAVRVVDEDGRVVARGAGLARPGRRSAATRLVLRGDAVVREDRDPAEGDLDDPVLMADGRVGTLRACWRAPSALPPLGRAERSGPP